MRGLTSHLTGGSGITNPVNADHYAGIKTIYLKPFFQRFALKSIKYAHEHGALMVERQMGRTCHWRHTGKRDSWYFAHKTALAS